MNIFDINKIDSSFDFCWCSECDWEGKVTEARYEWEQESWEMSEYKIFFCPICDADIYDTFSYTKEKYNKLKQQGYEGI